MENVQLNDAHINLIINEPQNFKEGYTLKLLNTFNQLMHYV